MFKRSLSFFQTRLLELNAAKIRCLSNKHRLFIDKIYYPAKLFEKPKLISLNCRNYAKSRNIRKEKQKNTKVDENELQECFDVQKLIADLHNPLERFKEELIRHATLRLTPNAIEKIQIKFENKLYSIQDLARVGKKNPNLYVLDFSSFPSAIPTVLSTLKDSELNVNVQQEGTKVFVPIPKVTKEYREALAKKIKLYFVKCKEAVRDVQMKYTKSLAGIEKLPSEKKLRITQQLSALGDREINLAQELLKKKHDELLKDTTF